MTATDDAARLGHWAYIAFHLPLVAGRDRDCRRRRASAIAHPTDPATAATAALILGGSRPASGAVRALFGWALDRSASASSRLAGLGALAALAHR